MIPTTLLSPEARLLLHSMEPAPDMATVSALLQDPQFDWDCLVNLAQKEKATTSLSNMLRRVPRDAMPPERAAQVSRLSAVTQFRMLHLEQLLAGALETLADRGIDVLLLKGAGLAVSAYGSFSARPMYDVDLLVRPGQAEEAWNVLREAGWSHDEDECPMSKYDTHHHYPPLDDPSRTGLSLELHASPCDSTTGLTGEAMWRDARRVRVHGQEAWVPGEAHQVVHLSVHFAWSHCLGSAAWRTVRDVRQVTESDTFNWQDLLAVVRQTRTATSCYWTLRLARTLGGVMVPDEVLRALRPPRMEPFLRILERHYISNLFRFSPAACPSESLNRVLWSAGLAPRWSGHGAVRPWTRDDELASEGTASSRTRGKRLAAHTERLGWWTRYLGGVLIGSHASAGRVSTAR